MLEKLRVPEGNNRFLSHTRTLVIFALLGIFSKSDNLNTKADLPDAPEPNKSYLVEQNDIDPEDEIVICEELPIKDEGTEEALEPEPEKTFEELLVEVDRGLKAGVPTQLTEKINRLKPKNICYVGDSYMVGITDDRGKKVDIEKVQAKVSRPMVAAEYDTNWIDDDIRTHAIEALNDPECKILVINGGLNDLYTYCHELEDAKKRVIAAYEEIFSLAWDKQVEVVVYDIPKTKVRAKDKAEINSATDEINGAIEHFSPLQLIDTDKVIEDGKRWRKKGMHPNWKGYRDLHKKIRKRIR